MHALANPARFLRIARPATAATMVPLTKRVILPSTRPLSTAADGRIFRADEFTETMWTVLERGAGFSRQWTTLATRIRDQFSVMLAESLSAATRS